MSQLNAKQIIELTRSIEKLVAETKKTNKVLSQEEPKETETKIPDEIKSILEPLKSLRSLKSLSNLDLMKENIAESLKSKPDEKKNYSLLKESIVNAINKGSEEKNSGLKKGIDQLAKIATGLKKPEDKVEKKEPPKKDNKKIDATDIAKKVVSSPILEKILSNKIGEDKNEKITGVLKNLVSKVADYKESKKSERENSENKGEKINLFSELKKDVKSNLSKIVNNNEGLKKSISEKTLEQKNTISKKETNPEKLENAGLKIFKDVKAKIQERKKEGKEGKEIDNKETTEKPNDFSISKKADQLIKTPKIVKGSEKKSQLLSNPPLINKPPLLKKSMDNVLEKKVEPKSNEPKSFNNKVLDKIAPAKKSETKIEPKKEEKKNTEEMRSNEDDEKTISKEMKEKGSRSNQTGETKIGSEDSKDKPINDKSLDEIKQILLRMANALESPLEVSTIDSPFRPDSRRV
jgi:hypothetical protein